MKPAAFEYRSAGTVEEAVSLLADLGEDAKVLAGGQSLVPMLALRLAQPAVLVDVNRIAALAEAAPADGGLALGALVRLRDAERSELIRERAPLLVAALPLIAHPQIRNRGTLGGSLAHADPAAELPAVALALDGVLVLRSTRGERLVPASEFFLGFLTTALAYDELLVELRLPAWPERAGASFQEVSRRHGDFALAAVAAVVELAPDGSIADARLAFSGVAPAPVRAGAAEELLRGARPEPGTLAEAAEAAAAGLEPTSDVHGSGDYRRRLAGVLARRALAEAAARAEARR